MNNWFKLISVPIILLSLLILLIGLVIFSEHVSYSLEHNSNISVGFHFPRYYSLSELAGPPSITEKINVYTLAPGEGDINWSDVKNNGPYDVVIIGDSFIGGCKAGEYLVNRISADNNISVLKIFTNDNSYFDQLPSHALIYLMNNNFFEEIQAKIIILEFCERGDKITPLLEINLSAEKPIEDRSKTVKMDDDPSNESYIDKLEISIDDAEAFFEKYTIPMVRMKTRILNLIVTPFLQHTIDGEVRLAQLNQSMFSHNRYSNIMLFHESELRYTKVNSTKEAIQVNEKLNNISNLLLKRDISLVYLPAISSYTIHYNLLVEKEYSQNNYYNTLESLNKTYTYINTKETSSELILEGVTDLYGTGIIAHWNWPLTKRISDELREIIEMITNNQI